MTLTDFLLARIAEDEAVARASHPFADWWVESGPAEKSGMWWVYDAGGKFQRREDAAFVAHNDPRRVLAECEARRRIVEVCNGYEYEVGYGYGSILAALALPYAAHPDYDESWRP